MDHSELSDRELLLLTVQSLERIEDLVEKHEERLDKLEAWRNYLAGGFAVISAWIGLKS